MRPSRASLALTLVAAAALAACGRRGDGRGGDGRGGERPTGRPGVSKATDAIPSSDRKGLYEDRFRFGNATDADGVVIRETDAIPPGSTAAMSFFVRNAPAETEVRIVWHDLAKDAPVDEEVKRIEEKGFVAFQRATPLPQGNYRVDKFYRFPKQKAWQTLGTKDFRVGVKS